MVAASSDGVDVWHHFNYAKKNKTACVVYYVPVQSCMRPQSQVVLWPSSDANSCC